MHQKRHRTCPKCGAWHVSTKFDMCKPCRTKHEQEQYWRNRQEIKSLKEPYIPTAQDLMKRRLMRLAIETLNRTETPMQELYNCKTVADGQYRITKFDKHLDPKFDKQGNQSSYITSVHGCECPQGHQASCRHRKMLPFFIEHEYVDTEYFFVWDTHQWFKGPPALQEARRENGKTEPARPGPVTCDGMPDLPSEGEQPLVSEAPSPPPSPKVYRRF